MQRLRSEADASPRSRKRWMEPMYRSRARSALAETLDGADVPIGSAKRASGAAAPDALRQHNGVARHAAFPKRSGRQSAEPETLDGADVPIARAKRAAAPEAPLPIKKPRNAGLSDWAIGESNPGLPPCEGGTGVNDPRWLRPAVGHSWDKIGRFYRGRRVAGRRRRRPLPEPRRGPRRRRPRARRSRGGAPTRQAARGRRRARGQSCRGARRPRPRSRA